MASIEDITFAIVAVDKEIGSLKVKYSTTAYTQGLVFQVDLPIGELPVGQALTDYLMQFAPVGQLTDAEMTQAWVEARKAQFASVDFSPIEALVPAPAQNDTPQPTVTGAQTL